MNARPLAVTAVILTFMLGTLPASAQTERPSAMQLFPAETALWVRTADAGLLIERFQQTTGGQLFEDPEMAPLKDQIGGLISDAYSRYAQEILEADLADLMKLPQGEIAFGMIHRENSGPGLMLIADFGERAQVAQQVFERLQSLAKENPDMVVSTEPLRSDEATVVRDGNNQSRALAAVRRGSAFVVANDSTILQRALDRWDGIPIEDLRLEAEALDGADESDGEGDEESEEADPLRFAEPLADNPTFAATLRELQPGNEEPPQGLFFINPIEMLKTVAGRETGVKIAMATFPSLGVDGIKAFGAAMWLSTDKWDSLTRGHLLLGNPRSGVVKIARLDTGETAPPDFVPGLIENYLSARTNPTRLFDDIAGLYDRFQFDGAFRDLVKKNLSDKMGIDFEQEFIGNLDGSVTYVTGYDETAKVFGAQTAIALGVNDVEAAKKSLAKIIAKHSAGFGERTFGSLSYHDMGPPRLRDLPPEERAERPLPVVGFLNDTLIVCQSNQFFTQMIEASEGQRERLNESLQYRLVRSRLERLTRGEPFSAFGFHDVEPMFRHFHKLATEDDSRGMLDRIAEVSPPMRGFRDFLDNAEFPPIEVLLKYTAPSGSVMIDTPTGWHMISFAFKRTGE